MAKASSKNEAPTKRYELVEDDTVTTWDGRKLFRIRALVAIGLSVAAGDLGGYVESENNLMQVSGNAWVYGNAQVYGDARVSGDARVHDFICLLTGAWWLLMTAAAGTAIGGSAAVVWPARHRIISALAGRGA